MKIPKRRECPCMSQDMTTCTSSKFNGQTPKGFMSIPHDSYYWLCIRRQHDKSCQCTHDKLTWSTRHDYAVPLSMLHRVLHRTLCFRSHMQIKQRAA